jgi:4-hydroxy-tetrahydrodipicolinate reductase
MGKEVEKIVEASETMTVAAKIDKMAAESGCYTDINDFSGEADIIIDFSNHLGTKDLLDYAVKNNIPTVVATTGHTPEELALIEEAGKKIAVFHSANMSLGVALLCELAVKAAATMPDADIEIVETHHNRKLDAPSGTALMIANAIKSVREKAQYVFGREGNAKREKNEIGVHAVRRGNIVGIHEVLVSTDSQTITLKHEAHSRALFAEGAVSAAEFILGKPAGLYNMNSIVTE